MASCLSHSVIATTQLIAYCRPYKHPSLITGSSIYLWRRHGSNLQIKMRRLANCFLVGACLRQRKPRWCRIEVSRWCVRSGDADTTMKAAMRAT
jgi:hypothetical protein